MRDLPLLPMPQSSPCSASGIYSKAQRHIDDVDTRLVLAMAARKPASTPNPALAMAARKPASTPNPKH